MSSLMSDVDATLDRLVSPTGWPTREEVVAVLKRVRGFLSMPAAQVGQAPGVQFVGRSSTPRRVKVANWGHGKCQWCGEGNPPDGSVVVREFGIGWWHDACYAVIRPEAFSVL